MSFQEYCEDVTSRFDLKPLQAKALIGIAAIAFCAIGVCAYLILSAPAAYSDDAEGVEVTKAEGAGESDEEEDLTGNSASAIYVHVAGCVANPGVYCISSDSRIDAAVAAAGGFTKKADTAALNLAEKLSDGQQIIVPEKMSAASDVSASISSSTSSVASQFSNPSSQSASSSATGLVNINTASASELQTLSGIGEAKAAKIIEYRESNGGFNSIDDLTNVSGIGEKTLESIRAGICV